MDATYEGVFEQCEDQRENSKNTNVRIEATYTLTFDINIDLADKNLVKSWFIKRGMLYINYADGTCQEIDSCDDMKYPTAVNVYEQDDEDVEPITKN